METETMATATETIGNEELQHQLRAGFAEVLGEVKALRGETDTRFAEVQGEIKSLRTEVLGEIKAVNARLDAQDKLLDARFDDVNQRIMVPWPG